MKQYIGTKIVSARPQNYYEVWCKSPRAIGDEITQETADEYKSRDGYKVVYEDGYTSWSPKDVFEKAYREMDSNLEERLNGLIRDIIYGIEAKKTKLGEMTPPDAIMAILKEGIKIGQQLERGNENNLVDYIYDFAWNYGKLFHIGTADEIKKAVAERVQLPEEFLKIKK